MGRARIAMAEGSRDERVDALSIGGICRGRHSGKSAATPDPISGVEMPGAIVQSDDVVRRDPRSETCPYSALSLLDRERRQPGEHGSIDQRLDTGCSPSWTGRCGRTDARTDRTNSAFHDPY